MANKFSLKKFKTLVKFGDGSSSNFLVSFSKKKKILLYSSLRSNLLWKTAQHKSIIVNNKNGLKNIYGKI